MGSIFSALKAWFQSLLPPSAAQKYDVKHTSSRPLISSIVDSDDGGLHAVGRTLSIGGRVLKGRKMGRLAFLEITDGSSSQTLQAVVESEVAKAVRGLSCLTPTGTGVHLQGKLTKQKEGAKQAVELKVSKVLFVGTCDNSAGGYPLAKCKMSMEFLRTQPHLRPRTQKIAAVMRIADAVDDILHAFLRSHSFVKVNTPTITTSNTEGAGEMFQVTTRRSQTERDQAKKTPAGAEQEFFPVATYLTVSRQLHNEFCASALTRVFSYGNCFRAENSRTSRHAAEFSMLEPEMAFFDIEEAMQLAQDCTQHVCKVLPETHAGDLDEDAIKRLRMVATTPFECCTYDDAIKLLEKAVQGGKRFEFPVSWGIDLASEHERHITEDVYKKPTIVYNYPKDIKPFYMRLNDDGKTVAAFDVLVPGIGELIGGGEREERLDVLIERMQAARMPLERYREYLDLRRFGTVPHSGFGVGIERLVMFVMGLDNIRDAIPFPRYPGHANC